MIFFDTYEIFEILNGNKEYKRYANETIITTVLNLGELYYGLLKQGSKAQANAIMAQVKTDLLEISPAIMQRAMLFRYINRKKKLSMVDCVGYALATYHGIQFLTGDKAFQEMPGVEFVK